MKFILKKNQIIITMLAALIAVAGYLNYADSNAKNTVNSAKNNIPEETTQEENTTYNSDNEQADNKQEEKKDIVSNDADVNITPGEAVIVNGSGNINFSISARLAREQVRATNKELLMKIINNSNISEKEKQEVISQLILLTDNAEKENAAETLLEAKGYKNAVVTITNDKVDVVIGEGELTDVQIAQIEDVVKRKADVSADKITITTVDK